MADVRIRTCTVCGEDFESARTIGRPPSKCSEACRRIAQRAHQRAYMRRLIAASHALHAAA